MFWLSTREIRTKEDSEDIPMIEIKEEGGCELYSVYIDGYFQFHVGGHDEINILNTNTCFCKSYIQNECSIWCTCKCHRSKNES